MNSKQLLLNCIKYNKWQLFILLMIIAVFSLTELAASYLLGYLVDHVVGAELVLFFKIGILVFINFGINSFCQFYRGYKSAQIANNTSFELKNKMYTHLMHSKIEELPENYDAKLSSVMMNEVNAAAKSISSTMVSLLQEPTIAVIAIIYLSVAVDWRIAMIACASAPITILIGNYFGKRLKRNIKTFYKVIEENNQFLLESLKGIRIIKAFLVEDKTCSKIYRLTSEIKQKSLKQAYYQGLNESIIIFTGFISYIGLYIGGGIMVSQRIITVGDLISAFWLVSFITWPIAGFGNALATFKSNLVAWDRLSNIFSIDLETISSSDKRSQQKEILKNLNYISFNNVAFRYPNSTIEKDIFNNATFDINIGDVVALIGENGTGKTTIFNLLLQFYYPIQGSITINGFNCKDIDPDIVRALYAYVSQEVVIWNGSLKDNILFGAKDEKVLCKYEDILRQLNLYDMLSEEDSNINLRSENLSTGFKQRLSLARAIVAERPIILLDEGTANVDKVSETTIVENFRKWFKDKIVIIISHSSIAYDVSNRFFFIQNEKINELQKDDERVRRLLLDKKI